MLTVTVAKSDDDFYLCPWVLIEHAHDGNLRHCRFPRARRRPEQDALVAVVEAVEELRLDGVEMLVPARNDGWSAEKNWLAATNWSMEPIGKELNSPSWHCQKLPTQLQTTEAL